MIDHKKLIFIGAGSMAEAMISGIIHGQKIPKKYITVTNRSNTDRLSQLANAYGINVVPREKVNLDQYDIIFLAMKPKDAENALQSIRNSLQSHQLIVSVLAGIKTSFIEQNLPMESQVIRIMPNTSSMIGASTTAISPGKHTSDQNLNLCSELLHCIGEVYVIPEDMMDLFTGIAGSGPAYFYYLMEQMEIEAINGGLTEELSRQIIAQTLLGAAKMVQECNETPATLQKNVTSPNGTTAAGLEALITNGGGKAIAKAIKQAAARSKEISSQLEKSLMK